jgi:hypothetical protein
VVGVGRGKGYTKGEGGGENVNRVVMHGGLLWTGIKGYLGREYHVGSNISAIIEVGLDPETRPLRPEI